MSNTLQIGLAVSGGLIVAGLAGYNAWQTRRNQPRQAQPQPDGEVFHAPTDDDVLAQAAVVSETGDAPVQEVAAAIPSQKMYLRLGSESKLLLDPLLDAIATIKLDPDTVVNGDVAIAALPSTRRVDNKALAVEGHNHATGVWEPPARGQQYDQFQVGVQLANRSGALNEYGFSEFTLKAQAFADQVNGTAYMPDMAEEVARARELDQFASPLDARLSFLLRARQVAWSSGYLHQCAAHYGFVPGMLPGRMVLPASVEGNPPILSLEYDTQAALADDLEKSAVYEVVLTLEVPYVAREEQAFARMCEIAHALANDMNGTIVDGEGRHITDEDMQAISQDLEGLYDQLQSRDFAAGSVLARRLFS